MLKDEKINQRLQDMMQQEAPDNLLWPENCAGSRKALVIFVGPSPGGKKEEERREINPCKNKPLWNEAYRDPIDKWSYGFRVSFKPIVEGIFNKPYDEAAKLIARVNMDWLSNPKSQDVSYHYMWQGCSYILPIIYQCNPDLIIPMDTKTFGVLQIALYNDGYNIKPAKTSFINIKISGKRYHRNIAAFKAQKDSKTFVVIKSLQHPARIYDVEYARRVGLAIKSAAEHIWNGNAVNLNVE